MNPYEPRENLSKQNPSSETPNLPPNSAVGGQTTPPPNPTVSPSIHNLPSPLEDALLDRFVDGELSEAEQQEVLRQVEASPENWRRLALAFVEAQTWQKTFSRFMENQSPPTEGEKSSFHSLSEGEESPPHPPSQSSSEYIQERVPIGGEYRGPEDALPASLGRAVSFPSPVLPQSKPSPPRKSDQIRSKESVFQFLEILALAGGIMITFLGGYFVRDLLGRWGVLQESVPVVQRPNHDLRDIPSEEGYRHPSPERNDFSQSPLLAKEGKPGSQEEVWLTDQAGRGAPSPGWEYVTLAAGAGPDGVPQVVRVPVRPFPPGNPPWLQTNTPPIPEDILQMLHRFGAEVFHRQEFIPLRLEDGRRIVVPVEQVELHYGPSPQRYQ